MKARIMIAGALAMSGLLAGLAGATSAAALPDITIQARHEFTCDNVAADHMYVCTGSNVVVPPGHQLRVAVRGSQGKLVKFSARKADGSSIGRITNCIKVGDPSELLFTAGAIAIPASIRAQLCEGGRVDVHATAFF
jgi:hypothetical protein